MALIVAGYWPTTYWPQDYWPQDYWAEWGSVAAPAVTLDIWQVVGWKMLNTTAITDLVSTRIYDGVRPEAFATGQTVVVPAINYFEIPTPPMIGQGYGIWENARFQISCRATSEDSSVAIADAVEVAFHRLKGHVNNFSIQFAEVVLSGNTIYEPETELFNTPVDIRVIFHSEES
jgi:hypothetical protein